MGAASEGASRCVGPIPWRHPGRTQRAGRRAEMGARRDADRLNADLIGRAKRLGVVVVQNPLHLDVMADAAGVPMMTARVGAARTADFQLMKSLLTAGVPLALGSDANGPPANPFLNIML